MIKRLCGSIVMLSPAVLIGWLFIDVGRTVGFMVPLSIVGCSAAVVALLGAAVWMVFD